MKTREKLITNLQTLIELSEQLEKEIDNYPLSSLERPNVDHSLLKVLYLSDEVYQVFVPMKSTGELHGLPVENVAGAKHPENMKDAIGIDYTPWFKEKTGNIKRGAKNTMKYWFLNVSDVKIHEEDQDILTPELYVNNGILSGLHTVKVYSIDVLNMLQK